MDELDPELYTIAWIAPLEVEAQAAGHMLDNRHRGHFSVPRGYDYVFEAGDINGHNIVIATLAEGQEYGTGSASNLATQVKIFFPQLRFGLLVGVAAGLPNFSVDPLLDIRLGDVLVAVPGRNGGAGLVAYDLGKETADGFELLGGGHVLEETETVLRSAISKIKRSEVYGPGLFLEIYQTIKDKRHSKGNFHDPGQDKDNFYAIGEDGHKKMVSREARPTTERTRVWYGPIGSGDKLMKSARARDELRKKLKNDNIIGLEMEAAGTMNRIKVAVIRGVCDYADEHKNEEWQPYAAAMAASYAKAVLYELGPGKAARASKITCAYTSLPMTSTIGQTHRPLPGSSTSLQLLENKIRPRQDPEVAPKLRTQSEGTIPSTSLVLSHVEHAVPQSSRHSSVPSILTLGSAKTAKGIPDDPVLTCRFLLDQRAIFLIDTSHGLPPGTQSDVIEVLGRIKLSATQNIRIASIQVSLVKQNWESQAISGTQTPEVVVDTDWPFKPPSEANTSLQRAEKSRGPYQDAPSSAPTTEFSRTVERSGSQTVSANMALGRLSLGPKNARNKAGGTSPIRPPNTHSKRGKVLAPGNYEYSFRLMVNNAELETIDTKFRTVKWKLRATVERPGTAGSPLQFAKKVPVVRVLPQLNAEIGEKMSNLSQLIDMIQYQVQCARRFPVGTEFPIRLQVMPRASLDIKVKRIQMGITQRVIHCHDDGNFICKEEDDIKILLSRTATKPQDIIAVDPTIEVGHDLFPGQSRPQEIELDPFRMWRAYNDQINYSDGTLVFSQQRPSKSGGNVAKDSYFANDMSTVVQIPSCRTMDKVWCHQHNLHPHVNSKVIMVMQRFWIILSIFMLDCQDGDGKQYRMVEHCINWPITLQSCLARYNSPSSQSLNTKNTFAKGKKDSNIACGCLDAKVGSVCE